MAALVAVLEAEPDVSTAILYGSAATGRMRRNSDIDVGIIAVDAAARLRLLAGWRRLTGEASLAAGRDVQIVDVEGAPTTLAHQVFKHGRRILERDRRRTAEVLERVQTEHFDGEYMRRIQEEAVRARFGGHRG